MLGKEALNDIEQVIYPKINFDGKLIKSISVVLESKWLLCINFDISLFSQIQNLSEVILKCSGNVQPNSLFSNDWQEKLHIAIHGYLQKHNLSFEDINSANKKKLVKYLLDEGAFNEKKAADYVAKILGLGRATVFKYLKELRNDCV